MPKQKADLAGCGGVYEDEGKYCARIRFREADGRVETIRGPKRPDLRSRTLVQHRMPLGLYHRIRNHLKMFTKDFY